MAGVYGGNPFAAAGEDMRLQQQHQTSAASQSSQAHKPPQKSAARTNQPTAAASTSRAAATPAPKSEAGAAKEKHEAWMKEQLQSAASTPAVATASGSKTPTNTVPASSASEEESSFAEPSWQKDKDHSNCACCQRRFDTLFRRHHCRGCGIIFCANCTPPPKLMLPRHWEVREPQRACVACAAQLTGLQRELVAQHSNANRENNIWGGKLGVRRYFNKPVAFTLGGEIRKAAHSINNLMGGLEAAIVDDHSVQAGLMREAKGLLFLTVAKVAFGAGLHVGSGLLVVKLGEKTKSNNVDSNGGNGGGGSKSGGASGDSGAGGGSSGGCVTGGVQWSAPCAVGMFGLSLGIEAGLETIDMVVPITDGGAVASFAKGTRHLTLGREAGLTLGPIGRHLSTQRLATKDHKAPVHVAQSYNHSRGVYGGVSVQGTVVSVRRDVNLAFYGQEVEVTDLFWGKVAPPEAAEPLYKKLDEYRVWAGHASQSGGGGALAGGGAGMQKKTTQEDTYEAL